MSLSSARRPPLIRRSPPGLPQGLLFSTTKPFSRGPSHQIADVELLIDGFVALFRISPHNNDILKVCLSLQSPTVYHFVLVSSLHK